MVTKLYLDVDGVINAGSEKKLSNFWSPGTIRKGVAGADGFAYDIIWSQQMVDELFGLGLDLIWTTTWRQHAGLSISPLIGYGHEAPYFTNSFNVSEYEPSISWKVQEVISHQKENPSKFVWIDDEIDYVHRNAVKNFGGLIISPLPEVGIVPEHLELIKDYLAG